MIKLINKNLASNGFTTAKTTPNNKKVNIIFPASPIYAAFMTACAFFGEAINLAAKNTFGITLIIPPKKAEYPAITSLNNQKIIDKTKVATISKIIILIIAKLSVSFG